MKPYRGDIGYVGWSSFLGRPSWRRLHAIAIAVLLLLPIGASPAQATKNSGVGGFDRSCLSAPRRAQYLFAGSR